jgi:undecaprenyl-diphosphatase
VWQALVIGVAQGMAVWPGLSRSGSTIAVALLMGWRWDEAARFSFLLSIPAVAGAILVSSPDMTGLAAGPVLTGIAAAFVVGCLAIWLLMKFLAAKCLWPFAVYCAGIGAFALLKEF